MRRVPRTNFSGDCEKKVEGIEDEVDGLGLALEGVKTEVDRKLVTMAREFNKLRGRVAELERNSK